ncbi:MAG TPA: biopolymer transporter ExbD [Burkholderiales bacterium]|nr:biopolymer transporter ExbD [Burkholderiales bacterium]
MMEMEFLEGGSAAPMAEINTTPLVDVMLVLLVIFIITAPLFHEAVQIDLPRVDSRKLDDKPLVLHVAIDRDGGLFLDGAPVAHEELAARFAAAVRVGTVAPELHLRADRDTRYEVVTDVMATAQNAGIAKIAFVTDPQTGR